MVRTLLYSFLFLIGTVSHGQERLFEEAQQLYRDGNYEEALSSVNEYLGKRTTSESMYLKSGILQALGKDFEAIEVLTNLIRTWPDYHEAYLSRAYLCYHKEFNQLAIEDLNFLIDNPSNDTKAIFYRMDPTGATQMQITSLASMRSSLFKTRGELHQREEQYQEALSDIDQALLLEESVENYVSRGLLRQKMGQRNLAIDDFRSALRIDDQSPLAWYNLVIAKPGVEVPQEVIKNYEFAPFASYDGAEAMREENYDKALRLFSIALTRNPEDHFALENMGRTLYAKKEYKKALEAFQIAYKKNKDNRTLLYLIGNTYVRLQEHEAAVAYYQQYLAHDPTDGSIWYNIAISYRNLGNHFDTCRCLKNAEKNGFEVPEGSGLWESCDPD